jgi:hypothetical protein
MKPPSLTWHGRSRPWLKRQYLEQCCGADRALRARLEALLKIDRDDRAFLERPAEGMPTAHATGRELALFRSVASHLLGIPDPKLLSKGED